MSEFGRWVCNERRPDVRSRLLVAQKAQARLRKFIEKSFPIGSAVTFWHADQQHVGTVAAYVCDNDGLVIKFPDGIDVPKWMRVHGHPDWALTPWPWVGWTMEVAR